MVEIEFVMLRWDDIARTRMRTSLPKLYVLMSRTLYRYFATGAFFRLLLLRAAPTLVGLYPPALMSLFLLFAAMAALASIKAVEGAGLPDLAAAPVALAAFWTVMRLSRRADEATYVYYLMADLAFTADHAAGSAPDMEARIDVFARRIAEAGEESWDEVLVVGHSSGAAYAASAAARALEISAGRLSLLTLGQTIPMLSFLPGAERLRTELTTLARAERVDWVDVSSPADGGCYALVDAAAATGAPRGRNPKVVSARFRDGLSPESLRAMRGRWFRKHIQYLCAYERPAGYDYFSVTSGSLRLADRFADRRDSPKTKPELDMADG